MNTTHLHPLREALASVLRLDSYPSDYSWDLHGMFVLDCEVGSARRETTKGMGKGHP